MMVDADMKALAGIGSKEFVAQRQANLEAAVTK